MRGALTEREECGEKVGSMAAARPIFGAPPRMHAVGRALPGCLAVFLVWIVLLALVGRTVSERSRRPAQRPPKGGRGELNGHGGLTATDVVEHRFSPSARGRHQIRAAAPGTWGEGRFKEEAVRLAQRYPTSNGAYVVHFFDSGSCLKAWDGTGAVRQQEEAHYLGRVVVDTNESGELYAGAFTPGPYE